MRGACCCPRRQGAARAAWLRRLHSVRSVLGSWRTLWIKRDSGGTRDIADDLYIIRMAPLGFQIVVFIPAAEAPAHCLANPVPAADMRERSRCIADNSRQPGKKLRTRAGAVAGARQRDSRKGRDGYSPRGE